MEGTEILYYVHQGLPRQGPGGNRWTRQAYECIPGIPQGPRILDIGCGPGVQTLELARLSGGRVLALDVHEPFLKQLDQEARHQGLSNHVTTVKGSMFELEFEEDSFDLIWAEGSIYIIGFEEGLRAWKRLLKPGRAMAVTEITWLKEDPPADVRDFWTQNYEVKTVKENLDLIARQEYHLVSRFELPEEAWWTDYYHPFERRLETLRRESTRPEVLQMVEETQAEIDLYRKYSEWYGYVFYVMRKPGAEQG